MKKTVGVWIDHRKAVLVIATDKGEEIKLIVSKVDKQRRRTGGVCSPLSSDSHEAPADDIQEREFTGHLNIYYDAVISCIRDAEAILIFGPGEAKGELKKRIVKNKFGGHIVDIETADKMTDRQIAAEVRRYFAK